MNNSLKRQGAGSTMKKTLPFEPNTSIKPQVFPFFDKATNTFSYVVKDPASSACAIIDSVMGFDYPSASTSYTGADEIIAHVKAMSLSVQWIIETHVHADHLSAAPYLQQKIGGKIAIGSNITAVQKLFAKVYNLGDDFAQDGSQFDRLLSDGDSYNIGTMTAHAIHTPGHTPACMVHVIGDAAFVGDTLFMPDGGTARADLPGGDARKLYQSIQTVLNLPDETRLFMCHDYCPNDREVEYETTVAAQRANNIHVHNGIMEDDFVALRETRDATLGMPKLILPALQVNMRAGHLPAAEDNGSAYLKIPLNTFKWMSLNKLDEQRG